MNLLPWRRMNRRPRTSETELALWQIRGGKYPPTKRGLELALRDLVPHLRDARVIDGYDDPTLAPWRAVAYLALPWWAKLTFGIFPWVTRRRARRVLDEYRPAAATVDIYWGYY